MPERSDKRFISRRAARTPLNGEAGIAQLAWHSVIHTDSPAAFRSTVAVVVYPSLSITRIAQTPADVERSQQITDAIQVGTIFVFMHSGRMTVEQSGASVVMTRGDLVVLCGYAPYMLTVERASDMTMVLMARNALKHRGAADYLGGARAIASSTLTRSVHGFLSTLTTDLPEPETAPGSTSEQALQTMLAGVLLSAPETRALWPDAIAPISVQVIDYLHSNSRDSTLSASSAASALNLSLRHLQRVLSDVGHTFSGTVRARRLRDAIDLLSDPSWSDASLSTVASAVGFGSTTRMRRAFQEAYGTTPNDFRSQPSALASTGVAAPELARLGESES